MDKSCLNPFPNTRGGNTWVERGRGFSVLDEFRNYCLLSPAIASERIEEILALAR